MVLGGYSGVYILPISDDDEEALEEMRYYRKALAGSGARGMQGTDSPKKDRQPGWLLRRIPGIGPKKSEELLLKYGTVHNVFNSEDIPGALGKRIKTALGESHVAQKPPTKTRRFGNFR